MRRAFYRIESFSKLQDLAQQWEVMSAECRALDAPTLDIDRVGKSHDQVAAETMAHVQAGGEYGWLQGWGADGANPDWLQYALVYRDQQVPFACQTMPTTMRLLAGVRGIKVCTLAKMKAHTFLTTHSHPELRAEGLLQFHITLEAATNANYAYLNVAGEFRQNVLGSSVVFDGSLDHFALNGSQVDRTILYMEFQKDQLMVSA